MASTRGVLSAAGAFPAVKAWPGVVAALPAAVLVVEAGFRSGTLDASTPKVVPVGQWNHCRPRIIFGTSGKLDFGFTVGTAHLRVA